MLSAVFIIILLQICSARPEPLSDSSVKSSNSPTLERLNVNSVVYELVNRVNRDAAFVSGRCLEELSMISEGIKEKEIWSFKRKWLSTN